MLYLPTLELRTTQNGEEQKENLHVIKIGQAGRGQVHVLHWEKGKPTVINNNQIRYSYNDLIGSSILEVDNAGNIISQEEYYPYGGTAIWSTRNQTEADYKIIRYSGKERDATGLYYYGYRYYQPWAGRWLSADPAGTVDGLNLYRMVRNNPVTLHDIEGMAPTYQMQLEKTVSIFREHGHQEAARIFSLPNNKQNRILPPLPSSEELGLTAQEVSAVKLYTAHSYTLINQYARGTLESGESKKLQKVLNKNKFLKIGFIGKESLETGVAKFNTTLESSRKKHPSNENFGNVVFRGVGFDYPGGAQDETQYTTIGRVLLSRKVIPAQPLADHF